MVRDCYPAPVTFTGVWDTVGSGATTNHLALLTGGDHSFLDVNPSVEATACTGFSE